MRQIDSTTLLTISTSSASVASNNPSCAQLQLQSGPIFAMNGFNVNWTACSTLDVPVTTTTVAPFVHYSRLLIAFICFVSQNVCSCSRAVLVTKQQQVQRDCCASSHHHAHSLRDRSHLHHLQDMLKQEPRLPAVRSHLLRLSADYSHLVLQIGPCNWQSSSHGACRRSVGGRQQHCKFASAHC